MGTTISILSPKGGSGKSTLSILLPTVLYHKKGLRVMVIDADYPQLSVLKKRQREMQILAIAPERLERYETLYAERPPYPILGCKLKDCPALIQKHRDQYDIIFVDVPTHIQQSEQHPFYKEINYFFVPLIPEELSLENTYLFYRFIQRKIMPHSDAFQRCIVLLNKVQAHHKLSSIRSLLQVRGADIMDKVVREYKYYEQEGRSTLFPMNSDRKETKLFEGFVENFLETIYPVSIAPLCEEFVLKL